MPASFSSQDFYACPGCGHEVRVGSPGCSRCAPRSGPGRYPKDEGWDEADPCDDEGFVDEEFGRTWKPRGIAWHWWLTALALLAAFAWMATRPG
jgi:hypothetical protein